MSAGCSLRFSLVCWDNITGDIANVKNLATQLKIAQKILSNY
jgi:hypothetical protein